MYDIKMVDICDYAFVELIEYITKGVTPNVKGRL